MPKPAKVASILVKLPPNMANAGWDIDADMVIKFAKEFGIKWNISFRWSSARGNYGSHCAKRNVDGYSHSIVLSQVHSREEQVVTILHELCHAMQNERLGVKEFDREYTSYHSSRVYRNVLETEAETFAFDNREKWDGILY